MYLEHVAKHKKIDLIQIKTGQKENKQRLDMCRKCFVRGCTMRTKSYRFPKKGEEKRDWMGLCGIPGGTSDLVPCARVCKHHFEPADLHKPTCKQVMAMGRPCVCVCNDPTPLGLVPKLLLPPEGVAYMEVIKVRQKRAERAEVRNRKKLVEEMLSQAAKTQSSAPKNDSANLRQYLPEEFLDRSWMILPEDKSNLEVFSENEDSEIGVDDHVKQEPGFELDDDHMPDFASLDDRQTPDIFFLGDMCRICAEKCVDEVQIFGDEDYSIIINKFMPIEVLRDDKLPLIACNKCLETVKNLHALTLKCKAADLVLKGHLAEQLGFEATLDKTEVEVTQGSAKVISAPAFEEVNSSAGFEEVENFLMDEELDDFPEIEEVDIAPEVEEVGNFEEDELLLRGVTFFGQPAISARTLELVSKNSPGLRPKIAPLMHSSGPSVKTSAPASSSKTTRTLGNHDHPRPSILKKKQPQPQKPLKPPVTVNTSFTTKPGVQFISSKNMPKLPQNYRPGSLSLGNSGPQAPTGNNVLLQVAQPMQLANNALFGGQVLQNQFLLMPTFNSNQPLLLLSQNIVQPTSKASVKTDDGDDYSSAAKKMKMVQNSTAEV